MSMLEKESVIPNNSRYLGLFIGPLILLLTLIISPPLEGLSVPAWRMIGLATLMAVWWVTEAAPIPVTSFLPIILSPLLGTASIKEATAAFANPLIFLFLGGFLLSIAMEKWNLHKRVALLAMLTVGNKPAHQIGGLMMVTAFLSMWMSNTATAVMMLPIGMSIIGIVCGEKRDKNPEFASALLLGIAYSASIGGLATLIGTPPNALLAAYLADSYNMELGFGKWMMVGLPLSIIMLGFTWVWLTKISYKLPDTQEGDATSLLGKQLKALGKLSKAEKWVAVIFVGAALSWVFRPLLAKWTGLPINDTSIAMFAALLLFIIPINVKKQEFILDWESTKKLPWGVLLLFGGGLSLAAQIKSSGLADFIGDSLASTGGMPIIIVMLIVTAAIIFLTEVTSNTATAAGFLPLLGPIAIAMGQSPAMLAIPAALAASCAFMMPVATPPNSIVFASGQLRIKEMIRAGFMLNIVGIFFITGISYTLAAWVFGL
ncbi:SLC13 family permease [Vibrio algicola]|uniref:DASS family sodium-coupled anion symporter n=1 Tax=Vibrio algicola TaxID=2662262 RepID=A0A5Q0TFM6_9VIBR|nr:DASS family sodium-coupled anion symporter [Vibrio algicola]